MPTPLQQLIGNTLRRGVTLAFIVTLVGGIFYLCQHGGDPMPDYTHFSNTPTTDLPIYTSLSGIISGLFAFDAQCWIQAGVVILILTPILRVVLSLFDFALHRDWLYVGITTIVLLVIIANSFGGK